MQTSGFFVSIKCFKEKIISIHHPSTAYLGPGCGEGSLREAQTSPPAACPGGGGDPPPGQSQLAIS